MNLLIIYTCLYFILFTLVSEFVMGLKNIIKWNQLYTCYEPHAVHINFLVVCVYIYIMDTLTLNITWVVVNAGVSSSTL